MDTTASATTPAPAVRRDRTRYLYLAVIVAVVAGIVVGLVAPDFGKELKPIGTGFVNLIKMMISPVIFCTIVLGVGSVRQAAKVGKVGGLALGYFLTMSTVALAIGLVVGNLIHPGSGLNLGPDLAGRRQGRRRRRGRRHRRLPARDHPDDAALLAHRGQGAPDAAGRTAGRLRRAGDGPAGRAGAQRASRVIQRVVFKVLAMIMWLAPIGAFGAMAAVVGATGVDALKSLAQIMLGFYATCLIFVLVVLGALLWFVARISIFSLLRYLGREFLLILSTSSSESALPRLIAKMEHFGVSKPVVGITVPTGYSFNLDGTAIYLTMASLFIADALGKPLAIGEQISLLLFMIIASKGAAGVTGAGLATLAGGLQSHRPDLVDGVGLIVGIDRFMSEARALTNFAGNAVATVLVGTWTGEFDRERAAGVLERRRPVRRGHDGRRARRRRGGVPPRREGGHAGRSPGLSHGVHRVAAAECRRDPVPAAQRRRDPSGRDPLGFLKIGASEPP